MVEKNWTNDIAFETDVENIPVIKKGESLPAVEIGIHSSLAHRFERQMTHRPCPVLI
jgi:hypothetical protein